MDLKTVLKKINILLRLPVKGAEEKNSLLFEQSEMIKKRNKMHTFAKKTK